MAEEVGGAIVGAVLNELIVLAERAYRCKGDCRNLLATLESVKQLLTNVEQSSVPRNATYQAWLKDLQNLLVKAKGIVQFCDKESQCSFVKKFALSLKIQDIDRQIQGKLSSEGNLIILDINQGTEGRGTCSSATSSLVEQPQPSEMQHLPSYIVAFNKNPFKKVKDLILSVPSDATKTIGIKGRGGGGKTLIVKMVHNDEDIRKKYGIGSILWLTIGQDVLVSSIYERMGKFLNDGGVFERDIGGRDLEAQRTYLIEAFKQKQALVILDDVWGNTKMNRAMVYWLDICKGDGSTTLITTRDEKVLECARATERIEVELLSNDESWKLFSFHAFRPNMPPSRKVKYIAMEICHECRGLPLALVIIGCALWDTKGERNWKYALSCLRNSYSWTNSSTMENELFHRLKFSYDVLSGEAKKCFLYFAAFPEDYCVPIKQLYSIWQAEKLFGLGDGDDTGLNHVDDTLNTGRMNLITLADRSLIELDNVLEHAKVHDVVRDLAMRIIQDAKMGEWAYKCHFQPGKVLETLPKIKETTKRLSLMDSVIKHVDPQSFNQGHNLRICLLSSLTFDHGSELSISLPENFFLGMTRLLYLNLSKCYYLHKLPKSIKELKSLTHLYLSLCKSLKELTEDIKELESLTHLDLNGCESLKELPESIEELKSLLHLNLSRCKSLEKLPESIKGLKFLTCLDLTDCESLKELPDNIKELKSLIHLYLSGCESLKELPKSIKELKFLTHLFLRKCKSLKELPESIKGLRCLTHLDLSWCTTLTELPESIKELKSLTHLNLSGCESLKELPESIKELKSLTLLDLSYCPSLKELPKSNIGLKNLTHLYLHECKSLTKLPESIKELKCLTHLNLSRCESLEELPESIKELKSLKYLDLNECKSLKKL